MPKVRKIPQRMCVGCQEMRPKKEMTRVVKTPDNSVEIDLTGKRPGRGAYVCPKEECLQKAIKARRLEKALHHVISTEIIDVLKQGLVK